MRCRRQVVAIAIYMQPPLLTSKRVAAIVVAVVSEPAKRISECVCVFHKKKKKEQGQRHDS